MPVAVIAVNVNGAPGGLTTGGVSKKDRREPSAAEVRTVIAPAVYKLLTGVAGLPSNVGAGVPLCAAVIVPTVPMALLEEKPNCGLCEFGSAAPAVLIAI